MNNKDEIIFRLDIEGFYREALPSLSGTGKQRKALCLFHPDETPSLSIDVETGLFNCFACGEKGSVIDFTIKSKGLDFKEALTYLSERAGLSSSAISERSAAKSKTPPKASQKAAKQQNKEQGKTHAFTLDAIKNRALKGGYQFIRLHEYTAAKPPYLKAIYRNAQGDKQARFYTLTDKDKGLYIDKRTSAPVLYNQKALSEDSAALVVFVEGCKDVDTLTVLGFLSVTAGGGNDWRLEFANHFKGRDVVIIPDTDLPGEKHADTVSSSLNGVASSVKILHLQGLPEKGDSSDFVEQRRKQGKTNEEIKRELQDLIETAAKVFEGPWLAIPEGWPYFIDTDGNLCRMYQQRDGAIPIRLCNFDAAIIQEIIEDDGTEDLKRLYVIEGKRGKTELHPLEVFQSKFEALTWHRQWGAQTVIEPGTRAKDLVRHAIETRSKARNTRRVFTHTGWREIGGKKVYLTNAGGIGAEGVEVRLPGELKRYSIPLNPENELEAIKTSFDFLEVGRHEITYPLFLMAYLAPLTSILNPMFAGFLYGERDTYKTSIAVLSLCHFGNFMDKVGLQNFGSSSGSLEKTSFLLKDVMTCIDDFHPAANRFDADKMQKTVQDIIRGTGNRTGRGRLNSDATLKETSYARGMVLITAEKLPAVQSTRTRTLTVEIKRGDLQLEQLTGLQDRASLLPHAMSSFILWLQSNLEWIEEEKRRQIESLRKIACRENSHKLAEHISMLQYAALLVCNWLADRQAISKDQASELHDESWNILLNLSREHRQLVEEEDPVRRFIEILQGLCYQGAVRITDKHYNDSITFGNVNGRPIGFADEEWLFLIPEALWREVEVRCRETGATFPTDRTTLFKTLKNRGLTKTDTDKTTRKFRPPQSSGTTNVLQLKRNLVFPDKEGTEGTEEDNAE